MTLLFWACACALFYIAVGYPIVMASWAQLRPRKPAVGPDVCPEVTVIVVAHNERAAIEARVTNLLALDYPRDRLSIIVASDGSIDDTVARARKYQSDRLRVLDFEGPRGKPAVLRDAATLARGPLLVFCDTRQRLAPHALRALVRPFADARVGAASGALLLVSGGSNTGHGLGFYWRYEQALRHFESRADSLVGVTGAFYAVRRELFEPVPDDTLLDDVLIPMRIVRRGHIVVLAEDALAYDRVGTRSHELRRHARTMAGNFQLFARERWLLDPRRNPLWFQTVSHKALRLLLPALLPGLFLANFALLFWQPLYLLAMAAQLTFYIAATLAWLRPELRGISRVFSAPYGFCLLSAAVVVGLAQLLRGRVSVTWRHTHHDAVQTR